MRRAHGSAAQSDRGIAVSAVVALVEQPGGDVVAVRFASASELYAWEDAHPEVAVSSMRPLVTRSELLRAVRRQQVQEL